MKLGNFLIASLLVVAVLLSGCTQYGNQQQASAQSTSTRQQTSGVQANASNTQPAVSDINNSASTITQSTSKTYTVSITAAGFSPASLTINKGYTVTWVNNDNVPHWPASNPHPIHNGYPEGGGCIGSLFDACHGLAQGESWSFQFNYTGIWGYHDHLNPGLGGTITVQ